MAEVCNKLWVAKSDHSVYSCSSLRIFWIFSLRSGKSFSTISHTSSRSTPKYSWIRISLVPAMTFHGISGYLFPKSLGIFLIAYNFKPSQHSVLCFHIFHELISAIPCVCFSIIFMLSSTWSKNVLTSFTEYPPFRLEFFLSAEAEWICMWEHRPFY